MNLTNDGSNIVDINELIVKYIRKFPFPSDIKKEIDLETITYQDIEDSNLLIDQKSMEYIPRQLTTADETSAHPPVQGQKKPKNNVVYSSVFKNSSSSPQENNFSTSRETKSTTHVNIAKAVVKEGSFSIQLQAPTPVIQANAGFKKTVSINKSQDYLTEEVMSWNAQSKIIVPPHKKIRAELVVIEEELNFDFQIQTILSGTLRIYLRNKKTGWRMKHPLEIDDLSLVFTKEHGFTKNPDKSVTFVTQGSLHSKFGISQKLNLIEEELEKDD